MLIEQSQESSLHWITQIFSGITTILRGTERGNNYFSTDDGAGMNKLILPDRYYTFDAIAEKLKEQDVTLRYDPNTLLSKVETKLPLRLWRLGRLLGFDEKTEISANSSATSTNMININDGLQIISVLCDKINSTKNFFNGNRTQVFWSFCIPSNRSLKGVEQVNLKICKLPNQLKVKILIG